MKVAGIHAVEELLKSEKNIEKVFVNQKQPSKIIERLLARFRGKNIPVKFVPPEYLHKLYKGNHQGIIAITSPVEFFPLEKSVETALKKEKTPLFLLLDGITDARNFGAIIRSAVAFEADGLIIPAHHSAPVNEDTVKMSAGTVFHIRISRVKHLSDALFLLKSYGFEIVAATEKANKTLENHTFSKPVALIMGNESKGIGKQLLKISDTLLKINMAPQVDSLNVSVATAIFLYEIHKQLK